MGALSYELNTKEAAVLASFPKCQKDADLGEMISIEDLARDSFAKRGTGSATKGNSWVRNSLRKLLRLGLVKHGGTKSGKYARTKVSLEDLKAAVAKKKSDAEEAKKAKAEARAKKKAAKSKDGTKTTKAAKKTEAKKTEAAA